MPKEPKTLRIMSRTARRMEDSEKGTKDSEKDASV